MSLFTRTATDVDNIETAIKSLEADTTSSPQSQKDALTTIQNDFAAVQPVVAKFVSKADAGEADPNKRIYGAAMVSKVRNLASRLTSIEKQMEEIAITVDQNYEKYLKEEQERKEKEAERKKKLEEEAAAKAKAEAEAAAAEEEKRRKELERIETEKRKQAEEQEKLRQEQLKKEEEEKLRKQKEAEAEAAKLKEQQLKDEQRKKEEEDLVRKQQELARGSTSNGSTALNTISVTIKTTRGKQLQVSNIPSNSTSQQLKEAIERDHNIPVAAQRLIYQGHLLADTRTIDSYGISKGSIVHVVENSRAVKSEPAASSSSAAKQPPTPIVPPGTVLELQHGRTEFQNVLDNCSPHRLVVVDWSAPWCGPCKMMAPVFKRLATRFPDVTFVKVDTECSMENASLAQEAGITAYPTFHYYIQKSIAHTLTGARATDLENNIKKYRTQVINSQAGASSSGATPTKSGELTKSVLGALGNLKKHCSQDEFLVAVNTLLIFVKNIVNNPNEAKYRRVRTANNNFQTKLATKNGGMQCMYAFGFQEVQENGEGFLILPEHAAFNPELSTVKSQLEEAISAMGGASSSSRTSDAGATGAGQAPRQTAPNLGGLNPGAFNPLGGNLPGNGLPPQYQQMMQEMAQNPAFAESAQQIMQNPTAMARILEIERAIRTGDFATIQRLQNDPTLTQLQNAIYQNPGFLNAMRRFTEQTGTNPDLAGMQGLWGQGLANMGNTPSGNQPNTNTQPNTNQNTQNQPSFPGAPTTAEEEERLLQEAIRLSMQDTNTSDQSKQEEKNDDQNNSGS